MNPITKFFLFCSGSSFSTLKRTPTEVNRHVGLGATIFFTGVLAALSGGYALWVVFESYFAAIGFGIIWGLMIFNLDRYIVTSMKNTGGFFRKFTLAIPRLVFAILIALVIAVPLELRIFDKEIQKELVIIQNEELQKNRLVVDSLYSLNTADLQSQMNNYTSEIARKEVIFAERQKEFDYERLGTESDRTSGNAGFGPLAKEKQKQMEEAKVDLFGAKESLQPKIDALEDQMATVQTAENDKFNKDAVLFEDYNGLAAQLQAFNRLKNNEPIIGLAGLFVMLLLLALETAPILVKLITPKGPYDYVMQNHEHSIERFSKDRIEERDHESLLERIIRKRELQRIKKSAKKTQIIEKEKVDLK